MLIKFKKSFIKDLNDLPKNIKDRIEKLVYIEFPSIESPSKIKGIKKIKGYNHYYRIKHDDYRIGIEILENEITFFRVLHRKEIYRFFP